MKTFIPEEKPRTEGGAEREGWAGGEAGVQHEGSGLALGREPPELKEDSVGTNSTELVKQ